MWPRTFDCPLLARARFAPRIRVDSHPSPRLNSTPAQKGLQLWFSYQERWRDRPFDPAATEVQGRNARDDQNVYANAQSPNGY
jgi:hypothetical protein